MRSVRAEGLESRVSSTRRTKTTTAFSHWEGTTQRTSRQLLEMTDAELEWLLLLLNGSFLNAFLSAAHQKRTIHEILNSINVIFCFYYSNFYFVETREDDCSFLFFILI